MMKWRLAMHGGGVLLIPLALVALLRTTLGDVILNLAILHPLLAVLLGIAAMLCGWCLLRSIGFLLLYVRVRGHADELHRLLDADELRRRARRRRMALVAGGMACALGLAICEVVFRVFGIVPPEVPELTRYPQEMIDSEFNVFRARETWDTLATDDPRLRILFLGDSFTYGIGVAREEAFPQVVENLITPQVPRGVVSINLGDPGTAADVQLHNLQVALKHVRPDVIVHQVYLNDFSVELAPFLYRIHYIHRGQSWLARQSHVWHYAERQYRFWQAYRQTLAMYRGGWYFEDQERGWQSFTHFTGRIRQTAQEEGAAYCMVLFPWLFQLERYPLTDMHEKVGAFAAEMDVPFLDLLEVYVGRPALPLRVAETDDHPNAEGHHMAAERIARFLLEQPEWFR